MARSGKEVTCCQTRRTCTITATGWREPEPAGLCQRCLFHPNLFPARLFSVRGYSAHCVIQAGTVVLALVIANMTGNGGRALRW